MLLVSELSEAGFGSWVLSKAFPITCVMRQSQDHRRPQASVVHCSDHEYNELVNCIRGGTAPPFRLRATLLVVTENGIVVVTLTGETLRSDTVQSHLVPIAGNSRER